MYSQGISHNISYPYIERCVVPWYVNISELLDLRARKYFAPPPPPPKKKKKGHIFGFPIKMALLHIEMALLHICRLIYDDSL